MSRLTSHEEFIKQLDRFHVVLKKNVSNQYQGSRQTQISGGGLTFKDYKDYVRGDDFRNIDWRVYARTDKFYIRRYEEERDLIVHIIVDASGSMNFGSPTKYEYASLLGIGFAYLALKNNEKFDFSTFAEEMSPVRAQKGKKQLAKLLDYLTSHNIQGKTRFESLQKATKLVKTKSFMVLISDFLYDAKEIESVLARYKHSQILCIQVLDPIETAFSLQGDYVLEDMELGTRIRTFITRRLKNQYRREMQEHIDSIKSTAQALGHEFITVHTGEEIFDAFYKAYKALS